MQGAAQHASVAARHSPFEVETCAEAGPKLLAASSSPQDALAKWVDIFIDFLIAHHGLAGALHGDSAESDALHSYFVERLVPVCDQLLDAALGGGVREPDVRGYAFLRGVGYLCIGAAHDSQYDARALARILVAGVLAER